MRNKNKYSKSPEKFSQLFFEALADSFAKMSYDEFETFISDELKNDYILLGKTKMQVSLEYKRAMLHYVAFLYYSTVPKQ